MSVKPFDDDSETAISYMRKIVEGFTEREQQVYKIVFQDGKTQAYAGINLGISEQRVGQIVNSIKQKLKENKELKKFFRNL